MRGSLEFFDLYFLRFSFVDFLLDFERFEKGRRSADNNVGESEEGLLGDQSLRLIHCTMLSVSGKPGFICGVSFGFGRKK